MLPLLILCCALSLKFAAAATIQPDDVQKALAASIATAPSPVGAAAAHQSEWSPGLVVALISEGAARQTKDPAAADALYRICQDVASKIQDSRTEALAEYRRGNLLLLHTNLQEAIPLLKRAFAIQTSALAAGNLPPPGNPDDKSETAAAADTAISLAIALHNSGLGEEATATAARAVELAAASDNELAVGRAYSVAGSAALDAGNNRAAIAYLLKALAIAEKLKSLQGQAAVLNNLGNASRQAFDLDDAAGYFQRSLAIKRQQGPGAHASSTLNNLGELALVQEHYDEADKYFGLALDAIQTPEEEDVRPDILINLGLLASQRREFAKSLETLDQAIALAAQRKDHGSLQYCYLFEVADKIELHQPAEAQALLDKGRPFTLDSGEPRIAMRYAVAQADIYREQGLTSQARNEYVNAIRQYEDMRLNIAGDESRQASYADNTRYVYTNLVGLDADSGQSADAFHFAELSKSRVLLDDLNSGRADVTRLLTPEEKERDQELLALLSNLNIRLRSASGQTRNMVSQQIDKVRFDYGSFRTGVYTAHPELALRRADPEPVSVARAAALLPDEHTALISWSVGADATYAFVIRRVAGKPVLHVRKLKTDEDKLKARVDKLRTAIAGRELGFTTLARELYDTLLKPLQSDLGKIDRLIVSPDASLWQIPLEALQNSAGKFVAEDYEIFYVPSATVLDRMRSVAAKRIGPVSVLALGDPAGDLPAAAAEVKGIGGIYGAGRSKVLTGSAATESALRANAGRYSVIHIAAHGRYDDAKPLYSYLALAPGKAGGSTSDDGNLEAREIMDLHLNARLVILSGCETARGSGSGVGIAGMSWSLFIAGAPATVASLWKVDSKSTSLLMTDLHRELAQGATPAKALHDARLALLQNPAYRHPFYWAGFIGIGAGN